MAANPALVSGGGYSTCGPAPFQGEEVLCCRDGIQMDIDSVRTPNGKCASSCDMLIDHVITLQPRGVVISGHRWSAKGVLFLTNIRMVFVASKPDAQTGLAAFDLPLTYIRNDRFNQPIFGCNNLSGECWPAVDGGGPQGTLPPHNYKLFFLEGGVGTFLPLYFRHITQQRQASRDQARAGAAPADFPLDAGQAFVDPNDPTTVFISQPVAEDQRLGHAAKYAANYGEDEKYEALV